MSIEQVLAVLVMRSSTVLFIKNRELFEWDGENWVGASTPTILTAWAQSDVDKARNQFLCIIKEACKCEGDGCEHCEPWGAQGHTYAFEGPDNMLDFWLGVYYDSDADNADKETLTYHKAGGLIRVHPGGIFTVVRDQ